MANKGALQALADLEQVVKRLESRKVCLISSLHDSRLDLTSPLPITVEQDGHQFIVYAPDLDIYGCADTEYESIEDLRMSIVELYFDLKGENLGSHLGRIWDHLASIIREK